LAMSLFRLERFFTQILRILLRSLNFAVMMCALLDTRIGGGGEPCTRDLFHTAGMIKREILKPANVGSRDISSNLNFAGDMVRGSSGQGVTPQVSN
jgi:hypothetical protein